jgi:hypothetical protein
MMHGQQNVKNLDVNVYFHKCHILTRAKTVYAEKSTVALKVAHSLNILRNYKYNTNNNISIL